VVAYVTAQISSHLEVGHVNRARVCSTSSSQMFNYSEADVLVLLRTASYVGELARASPSDNIYTVNEEAIFRRLKQMSSVLLIWFSRDACYDKPLYLLTKSNLKWSFYFER
jgi:hypothetical protein